MNQSTAPKKYLLLALLPIVVIAAAGLAYYFYATQQPGTIPKKQASDTVPKSVTKPDAARALLDLFGISGTGGSVKTAADALTGIWFEQGFTLEGRQYHVVFTKTQTVNSENSTPIDSHVQGVTVGAATYLQQEGSWHLAGAQKNIGEIGSWGDAPEVKQAGILALSPTQIAFMIDFGYGMGGFFEEGKVLFGFGSNRWQDLGFIQTGENNSGACDDSEQAAESDSPLIAPCWGYTGTITVLPETHHNFPDLLVVREGTQNSENPKVTVPANHVTYRFDGQKYALPDDSE